MKKITFAIFAILIAATSFVSCDNEEIDGAIDLSDSENSAPSSFKVNFDGQTYVATTTQAIVNEDYIAITGLKASTGEIFQLTVPSNQVGTYTWDTASLDGSGLAMAYITSSGGQAYISAPDDSGTFEGLDYVDTAILKVTEINTVNKTITGTFQFTGGGFNSAGAFMTKVFTEGSFTNISYSADTTPVTTNTFTAKLDGSNFIATNIFATSMSGKISIVGRRGNVENISLTVPENATPGTYDVDMLGDYIGMYVQNSTSTGAFGPDLGTITITSHNTQTKKIIGTFQFTVSNIFSPDLHTITEGTFNVGY